MENYHRIRWTLKVAALSAVIGTQATATIIVSPTSLSVGDQYRLVFITDGTTHATSTDIAFYNAFVSNAANAVTELAALGITWKAIGSTSSIDARDNTGTNPNVSAGVPIFQLNDTKIADSNADLWDGAVTGGFNLTETEQALASQTNIWTGSGGDGTANSSSTRLGDIFSGYGAYVPGFPNLWMHQGQIQSAFFSYRLYALSDVLTVVPEPGAALLLCGGLLGLAIRGRRRR